MNVLHISTPLSWRGGEQQLAYLATELKPFIGRQVFFCAHHGAFEKFAQTQNFTTFPYQPGLLRMLQNARQVRKICEQNKINLIHTHDSKGHTIAVLAATLGNKVPIVVSRRVDFPVSPNPFSKIKYNHPNVKKIICVSEKIKEITGASIKDKDKLTVVYDGIDVESLKKVKPLDLHTEFDIPEYYNIVGNIAAIAPHKDYFTWVDTAEILLLKNMKIRFLIVGEGPQEEDIKDYIQSKGLEEDIIMTGFRKDAKQLLAGLDIFLISSETEGLGSSILDAFACKVPVVATEAGGIPEIVLHKKTGLLAPVKATERLAEQIQKILERQDVRETLVENAYEWVQKFDKKFMAINTFHIYKEVLEG